MNHVIKIDVNGLSIEANAAIHHAGACRELEYVECRSLPAGLDDVLERCLLTVDDILYLTAQYALLHNKPVFSFACGPVDVQAKIMDPEAWRQDLEGNTFMVKLTDVQNNQHFFDVGSLSSVNAYYLAKELVHVPIRSSVCQPVPFV